MERRGRAAINGRAFAAVCRGEPWPSRGHCGSARSPGRCEHRPLQRFVITQGRRFPGWPRASSAICLPCQREVAAPPGAAGGIAPPRNAAHGSGRLPQGNPPLSALAPLGKGAFCAAACFHTFSPKPKPRSNAKPVRRAGTVHNFFTKTAKKLFNFFQMYGKVESLEQTNGPGPPAVWTK